MKQRKHAERFQLHLHWDQKLKSVKGNAEDTDEFNHGEMVRKPKPRLLSAVLLTSTSQNSVSNRDFWQKRVCSLIEQKLYTKVSLDWGTQHFILQHWPGFQQNLLFASQARVEPRIAELGRVVANRAETN